MQVVTIRSLQPHEWALYRRLRLGALQDAPSAFGSTYGAEETRTPEQWRARLEAAAGSGRDLPLVAFVAHQAAGLAWAKADAAMPPVVNVFQMWVHPAFRGRGVGAALLDGAIVWAKEIGARAVCLGVTSGDSPARRMYERAGFRPRGEPEPLREGSTMTAQNMMLVLDGAG